MLFDENRVLMVQTTAEFCARRCAETVALNINIVILSSTQKNCKHATCTNGSKGFSTLQYEPL